MTRIQDMSETERQSWATLIVDGFVFFWFCKQMTRGFGRNFGIETFGAKGLVSIYITVIIITIILHGIIAAIFAARRRQDETLEKDERDILIERKGAAYGFGFLAIAINIVVVQLLIENSFAGYEMLFTLSNVSHLFFILLSVAFIGDIIKNGVMVLSYRGG